MPCNTTKSSCRPRPRIIASCSTLKNIAARCFARACSRNSSPTFRRSTSACGLKVCSDSARETKSEATESLAQAAEASPSINGKLNEKPFDDLRDCDDLFGTVLEVISQGNYFWVPLETIESIALMPPRFPRDLLWIKAQLETESTASGQSVSADALSRHARTQGSAGSSRPSDRLDRRRRSGVGPWLANVFGRRRSLDDPRMARRAD